MAGVLAGDRCAQDGTRGICTDALMPRRSVREDDRPMCRYTEVSSQDRRTIPAGRVAVLTHPLRGTAATGPAPAARSAPRSAPRWTPGPTGPCRSPGRPVAARVRARRGCAATIRRRRAVELPPVGQDEPTFLLRRPDQQPDEGLGPEGEGPGQQVDDEVVVEDGEADQALERSRRRQLPGRGRSVQEDQVHGADAMSAPVPRAISFRPAGPGTPGGRPPRAACGARRRGGTPGRPRAR